MKIEGSIALVTGGNRGIGRHFVQQLLVRGAAKVYAAARNPHTVDVPGAIPVALDITDPDAVAAAAAAIPDLTLLVNNAGITTGSDLVTGDLSAIKQEIDTNFYGPLGMIRTFAPVLARNGGGAILNVNSRMSWLSYPGANAYAASKAASWSMTNGVRMELAAQNTQVTGLYLSSTDTDMMAGWDVPKNDPADVVTTALDGLETGAPEVLADQETKKTKASLAT
ncbi:SDR family oxidoreductase [Streptomyces clavifer]|uniref:SDR family oxidoreductase n=1 Tax=Streptomyces clavifer TaxID=68188 RepID=UPI0037A817E3